MLGILEKCNLSKNQAKVYLALLGCEKSSSSELAKSSGIDRRNAYDALAKLQKKGLVSSVLIGRATFFSAVPPARLLGLLHEEKAKLETQEKLVRRALPKLNKLTGRTGKGNQEVKTLYGRSGLKHLLEELLETLPAGAEYYTFGGMAKDVKGVTPFFAKFHRRRSHKGIIAKMLLSESDRDVGKMRMKEPFTEVRYIKSESTFPAAFHAYNSTVNIFMWYDEPIGIQVKNDRIAEAFKSFFNLIWAHSSA